MANAPAAIEPIDWEKVLRLIPGYDPFENCGECWFDSAAAQRACDFFPLFLRHVEGAMAGKPFHLLPWQQSVVGNLFGWMKTHEDGSPTRRYREALIYVPRKNGKTPLSAGIALYVLFADNEKGQQNYIAAGDREQAGMLFRQAAGMVEQDHRLNSRCRIFGGKSNQWASKSIVREDESSFLRVISSDAHTKHGGTTHLGIIDELHVQPNRDLYDVMRTSTASENRRQPLLLWITTADFARPSICNEVHGYACKVRDGLVDNESFLPVIYELTEEDDWTDPANWDKANPNLGVSVSRQYMKDECKKAQEQPTYENTFKRLHLNIRTQQDVRAIPMDSWTRCGGVVNEFQLMHRHCYAGLDLSTTTDITAFVMLFPPGDPMDRWDIICRFWIPGDNAHRRANKDRVEYPTWINQGHITAHDGNRLDYGLIRREINGLKDKYDIQGIAVDPWNGTQLMLELQDDGMEIVEFRQGFGSMTGPTKELLAMIGAHQLNHGNNPVLSWMAGNAATKEDPAGNIKFDKGKSTEKIDGIVALTMALGLAITNNGDSAVCNTYDTPGSFAL
jgi:phage terminase large subunit-like protein